MSIISNFKSLTSFSPKTLAKLGINVFASTKLPPLNNFYHLLYPNNSDRRLQVHYELVINFYLTFFQTIIAPNSPYSVMDWTLGWVKSNNTSINPIPCMLVYISLASQPNKICSF